MNISLVTDSPVPLYHQIVEAIRYRIATGTLPAGAKLPVLREAADRWGVNLHTVRHAYAELAKHGLVVTRGPAGTQVLGPDTRVTAPSADPEQVDRFAERVVRSAGVELGLSVRDLISVLRNVEDEPPLARPTVTVTECTALQSEDLARQFEARWHVGAQPWCFEDASDAPPGIIVGTYFHYNGLRAKWPGRRSDLRFVVIAPDADVAKRIRAEREPQVGRTTILLCELDDDMARNIVADLAVQLPRDDYDILPLVVSEPSAAFERASADFPILFSPRTWGMLTDHERQHARSYELTYHIDREDAERIARALNWRAK